MIKIAQSKAEAQDINNVTFEQLTIEILKNNSNKSQLN